DVALKQLGLTARQVGILTLVVERRPTSQRQLGETLGIDRTTMVGLLDDLEKKRLVERRRDAHDRRAFLIHPTKEGIEAQAGAVAVLDEMAATFLRPLSEPQRRLLAELLRLLEPRLR